MCKHPTSIGNISKSYQFMWNACQNFVKMGQFWEVTNSCEMLAHKVCTSIPHQLITFQVPKKYFQYLSTLIGNFLKCYQLIVVCEHQICEFRTSSSPRFLQNASSERVRAFIMWAEPNTTKYNQTPNEFRAEKCCII